MAVAAPTGGGGEAKEGADGEHGDVGDRRFYVGQQLDVLDTVEKWSEADVVAIDWEDDGAGGRRQVLQISYTYWSSRFDESIPATSHRIAPAGSHTYHVGGVLRVGQRVEAQDTTGKWLEAYVIEERPNDVKVHYHNFAPKFDEWLPRRTARIRPYGRSKKLATKRQGTRLVSVEEQARIARILARSASAAPTAQQAHHQRKIALTHDRYAHYIAALAQRGLQVVQVSGDGNCLFRSIAHQIYGDDRFHDLVRARCMDYMESERDFFSQFVEGTMDDFLRYIEIKRQDGIWGDDPEIQAMCEIYNRPAEIWAYDPHTGARKLRTFHDPDAAATVAAAPGPAESAAAAAATGSTPPSQQQPRAEAKDGGGTNGNQRRGAGGENSENYQGGNPEKMNVESVATATATAPAPPTLTSSMSDPNAVVMRVSYYGGGHYDSVCARNSGNILLSSPGTVEEAAIERSRQRQIQRSRHVWAAAASEQAAIEAALDASRNQFDSEWDDALDDVLTRSLREAEEQSVSELAQAKASSDVVQAQSQMLGAVKEQSEEEMLRKAMEASLSAEAHQTTEEELLQQALEASRRENEGGGAGVDSDDELRRVMEISAMNDDDLVRMAVEASLQGSDASPATDTAGAPASSSSPSSDAAPASAAAPVSVAAPATGMVSAAAPVSVAAPAPDSAASSTTATTGATAMVTESGTPQQSGQACLAQTADEEQAMLEAALKASAEEQGATAAAPEGFVDEEEQMRLAIAASLTQAHHLPPQP